MTTDAEYGLSGPRELARRATQLQRPEDGLAAVAALRVHLEVLEQLHVDNARRLGRPWSAIAEALGVSRQALHKKHAERMRAAPRRGVIPERGGEKVIVTAQARQAVGFARQEALALGHDVVGTGHVLLGVFRDPAGAAAEALSATGASLEAARDALDRMLGATRRRSRPAERHDRLPVSRATRRALERSLHEAVELGDGHLGVEHVLLALLREQDAASVRVLEALGVRPVDVEAQVAEVRAQRNVRSDA